MSTHHRFDSADAHVLHDGSQPVRSMWSRRIRLWLLPLLLFATATLLLGGDLGKFSDDYGMQRLDPVTGRADWHAVLTDHPRGFSRALHWRLTTALQTALWDHPRINHLIGIGLHLFTGFLLWRLLRKVGVEPFPAGSVVLLFLVYPMGMEAVFWLSANCGVWGAMCAITMLLCTACAAHSGRRRLLWLLLAALFAFLAPCWYEQPAPWAMIAGAIFFIAAPSTIPLQRRIAWSATSSVLCCVGAALYLVIAAATVLPGDRLSATRIVPPTEVWTRLVFVHERAFVRLVQPSYFQGAFAEGWRRLGEFPALASLWLCALAASIALWLGTIRKDSMLRGGTLGRADAASHQVRAPALIVVGVSMAVLCLLPVVAVQNHPVEFRMCYALSIAVAVLLAGVISTLFELSRWAAFRSARGEQIARYCNGFTRIAVAVLLLLIAVPSSIASLGVQSLFQIRSRTDQQYAAQLNTLLPDPPADAVFVPLHGTYRPINTGYPFFDTRAVPFFESTWWSLEYLQHLYHRSDIAGIALKPWRPAMPFQEISRESLGYRGDQHFNLDGLPPDLENPVITRIAWPRVVPFVVDEDGKVHLIDRLRIIRSTNDDFEITIPCMAGTTAEAKAAAMAFSLADTSPVLPVLTGWKSADSDAPPLWTAHQSWGIFRESLFLRAGPNRASTPSHIFVQVTEDPSPRRIHFRAAMVDWSVATPPSPFDGPLQAAPNFRGDGAMVVITLDGVDEPLAKLHLTPQTNPEHRAWVPLSVTIPPRQKGDQRQILRLTVEAGPANNSYYDAVLVTPGLIETLPGGTP